MAADAAFFSELREPARFLLIRHGQSEGNARKIMQGSLDLMLDEVGRSQAAGLGEWLSGRGVGVIVSSPLSRASETARIFAKACGLGEPETYPFLRELETGIFTGLSMEESRAQHPEAFAAFESASWDAVPGAEHSSDLYSRAMRSWELLRDRALAGGGTIVCVSHGGLIQWLVRATFGCRSWMPLFRTSNCGVFELYVEPSGRVGDLAYLQWERIDFRPFG
ncbi:MAG: histidine phosphatase family protein, partial [Spirochaetaceae bacterium]|nr:histidine phosphatase family protein [Spirochaetaceae bacterium]